MMSDSVSPLDHNGASVTGSDASDAALMAHFMGKPGFLLARIDQIATALFNAGYDGATLSQAEFLLVLDRYDALNQIGLARATGVDKSTTGYILDNLQSRGLIERSLVAGDRRVSRITLTDEGHRHIGGAASAFAQLQKKLLAGLSESQRQSLLGNLLWLSSQPNSAAPRWDAQPDILFQQAPSFLCRRALQSMNAQFLASTQDSGLTLRQFSLLFILSRRPSITRTEFAHIFGIDPATCAIILRGPARRGLIAARRSAADARARLYTLTDAGRALLERVLPLVDHSEKLAFPCRSSADRAALISQMQAIVARHRHVLRFPGAVRQESDTSHPI